MIVFIPMYFFCVRKYALMSAVCPFSKITNRFTYCLCMAQEGVIWPNITAEFVIVFKPEEAKLYQQTIFCDVTGQCLPKKYNAHLGFTPQLNKTMSTLFSHATNMALGRVTSVSWLQYVTCLDIYWVDCYGTYGRAFRYLCPPPEELLPIWWFFNISSSATIRSNFICTHFFGFWPNICRNNNIPSIASAVLCVKCSLAILAC